MDIIILFKSEAFLLLGSARSINVSMSLNSPCIFVTNLLTIFIALIHLYYAFSVLTILKLMFVLPFHSFTLMDVVILVLQKQE